MNKLIVTICLCLMQVLIGCSGGGGGGDGAPPAINLPPVADAGADQFTYDAAVVILAGTGSDPDGSIQSQQWEQIGGEQVILDDPTRPDPSFTAPSETGTLTFSYTVTDNAGAQHTDTIAVYVSKVLFSDSFDNSSSLASWSVVNDAGNTPSWQVSIGELYQFNNVDSSEFLASYHLGTFVYLDDPDLTASAAFRFSVDVTPRANDILGVREGNDVGIMFPYNTDNYYRLSMNARFGFTRLEKRDGTGFTTLAVNSIGYVEGQRMTITVEVIADTIIVLIDDEPIFAESNLTITPGTVALYCQDRVSFDNVVIADNSPQPMVAVSNPLAHSIALTPAQGNTLAVQAVALNPPAGSQVVFTLDDGAEVPATVSGSLYAAQFTSVVAGEHEVSAILKDSAGVEVNRDINTVVGLGGGYTIAVGDSITNGIGDEDPTNNDSADGRIVSAQGFVAPLDDAITASSGLPQIVFNEGIPGVRSLDLDGAAVESILERHPEASAMLLLIGTNDASSNTSAIDFQNSVTSIATAALVNGVDRVYIARILPRYDSDSATNATRNSRITEYNNRIVQIANLDLEDNLFLGPNFYPIFEGPDTTLYDPKLLHPNDAGFQVMADEWHAILTSTP